MMTLHSPCAARSERAAAERLRPTQTGSPVRASKTGSPPPPPRGAPASPARRGGAVASDPDRQPRPCKQDRLVAHLVRRRARFHRAWRTIRGAVATADDAGPPAAPRESLRERYSERRLAASSDGKVADDDDRHR